MKPAEEVSGKGKEHWDSLLNAGGGMVALQQSYEYGEYLKLCGAKVARLQCDSGDGKLTCYQSISRKLFGMEFTSIFRPHASWWKNGFLDGKGLWKGKPVVMIPDAEGLKPRSIKIAGGFDVIVLSLLPDEKALRMALHGKWRNRLCHTEKSSHVVKMAQGFGNITQKLAANELTQRAERKYEALPGELIEVFARLSPAKVITLYVKTPEALLAGMVFLLHGNTATYHLGWNSNAGKKQNLHNLLMWQGVLTLKAKGLHWLDLGKKLGVPGIDHFKLGMGAEEKRISGMYLR